MVHKEKSINYELGPYVIGQCRSDYGVIPYRQEMEQVRPETGLCKRHLKDPLENIKGLIDVYDYGGNGFLRSLIVKQFRGQLKLFTWRSLPGSWAVWGEREGPIKPKFQGPKKKKKPS